MISVMSTQHTMIFSAYEGQAWLDIDNKAINCTDKMFKAMWDLKPEKQQQIMMFGKLVPIPRYQAIWGRDYTYSGQTLQKTDSAIPELVQMCIDYTRKHSPEFDWNAALVNWYEDGTQYISAHSDDVSELVKKAPIYSFSFGGTRRFRVRHKDGSVKYDVDSEHGSCIRMGGTSFQSRYKHEIVKTYRKVLPRINVTVRCFK